MYIDVLSHQKNGTFQILVGRDAKAIHPWELKLPFSRDSFDRKWDEFICKIRTDNEKILAVGECGLDRVHQEIANIEDQLYVLNRHFDFASSDNLPIILHTVRAYSDLLAILKKKQFKRSILLHSYSGNQHEMHELLKYPSYFSYGARLFKDERMIKFTPRDRLLLETGDQKEYSIDEIYHKAAMTLGVSLEDLKKQLVKNFLNFFGKFDDVSATNLIEDLNRRSLL